MPDLNHPNQEQNGPFGGENKEVRVFKFLPLGAENPSYSVTIRESEQGNVETHHCNLRYLSGGVEITPTTVCGQCERCKEVNLDSAFINCFTCGKRICLKCRKALGKYYYCKWFCFFVAFCSGLLKMFFGYIFRIIAIPLRDILRG